MIKLALNAIYLATEGEGIHIGTPQIFVRFQGCAIGCLNCDSKETWEFTDGTITMAETLAEIENLAGSHPQKLNRVSITGGDPLHPKHTEAVDLLVKELKRAGYYINIEAAGTRLVDSIFDNINFVSYDLKTPSTGVRVNMKLLEKLLVQYNGKAQIKAVIADKKDFEFVYDIYTQMQEKHNSDIPWVLTPCYEPGEEFPKERFVEVITLNESYGSVFRVIGQQHKWIHGPNKQNV